MNLLQTCSLHCVLGFSGSSGTFIVVCFILLVMFDMRAWISFFILVPEGLSFSEKKKKIEGDITVSTTKSDTYKYGEEIYPVSVDT